MTLDCVRPTQFSVIQTFHRSVDLKCFFVSFTEMLVCYYCYIYAYFNFTYIFHKVV